MQIDDYRAAKALTEKISANLPIRAYLGKALLKRAESGGKKVDPKIPYTIEWVGYSGDEGGIMCTLKESPNEGEKLVTSITHIKIDPEHPLALEILMYQQERTMRLAIQDRGGFGSELLKMRSPISTLLTF